MQGGASGGDQPARRGGEREVGRDQAADACPLEPPVATGAPQPTTAGTAIARKTPAIIVAPVGLGVASTDDPGQASRRTTQAATKATALAARTRR